MIRDDKALIDKTIKAVFKTIAKFGMIEKGDSILVSISGGPDSIFLIQTLLLLRDKNKLELSCFHLDHMTRDGESGKDADFVIFSGNPLDPAARVLEVYIDGMREYQACCCLSKSCCK